MSSQQLSPPVYAGDFAPAPCRGVFFDSTGADDFILRHPAYNQPQPKETTMQTEMPILQKVGRIKMVSPDLIENCRTKLDAILLCIQLSRHKHEYISACLGIDKGNFSKMLQGTVNLHQNKECELMQICGNYAPLQWLAWSNGFDLQERAKDARIAALEAELNELKYG